MRRNSGYTRSASRLKATWSPRLQAFNRFVISVEDSPMDNPIPYRGKKVYQTVSAFAVRFPLVPGGQENRVLNDLLPKKIGETHETHHNGGTDAQPRCRRYLRTT